MSNNNRIGPGTPYVLFVLAVVGVPILNIIHNRSCIRTK